jgi:hypothetical protein
MASVSLGVWKSFKTEERVETSRLPNITDPARGTTGLSGLEKQARLRVGPIGEVDAGSLEG